MSTNLATDSRQKVSVRQVSVRGKLKWQVRWHDLGRVKRSFFGSEKRAVAFAAVKRNDALAVDAKFLLLPIADREKLLHVFEEARRRGLDLLALVSSEKKSSVSPSSEAVLAEMLVVKAAAGRNANYLKTLKAIVGGFIAGRPALPVDAWSHLDLELFLDAKSPAFRSTVRSRLATWFKFAVRRGFRPDNPCDRLEAVKVVKSPPVIFSPEQVAVCLKFFVANRFHKFRPKMFRGGSDDAQAGLGWFLLTTFAGLRPEEAMQVDPKKHLHLSAAKPHIEVTPEICKTGQWRIVYPLPPVVRALRWAFEHGSHLPMLPKRKQRLIRLLRAEMGLARWPKDVTRHSASSYWLAITNDQKHVAEMLGHSERMARTTYKKPVSKAAAKEFYAALGALK